MKVLVCHPGHSFSTSDVFDGLCAGLRMNGAEVVPFQWDRPLRIMGTLISSAIQLGELAADKAEKLRSFTSWLAAADAIGLALAEGVDAAIVVNGIMFPPDRAKLLQKLGIPVVCIGTEAPYFLGVEQQISAAYTHWFTNERRCVGQFQAPSFYLRHAYNPETHQPSPLDPNLACDVTFIGGGYPERRALLDGVDWRGIDLQVRGTLWHLDLDAERGAIDAQRATRYSEGSIPNAETSARHRSAKIALNMNRQMTHVETGGRIPQGSAESLGPRAFEIPAVGGFLLCDDERPDELRAIYGDSAATFAAWDSADLERQVRHWLAHPDAREQLRIAQSEAVRPHHWGARAAEILTIIT
jgi:spore maturation protein CgeB